MHHYSLLSVEISHLNATQGLLKPEAYAEDGKAKSDNCPYLLYESASHSRV